MIKKIKTLIWFGLFLITPQINVWVNKFFVKDNNSQCHIQYASPSVTSVMLTTSDKRWNSCVLPICLFVCSDLQSIISVSHLQTECSPGQFIDKLTWHTTWNRFALRVMMNQSARARSETLLCCHCPQPRPFIPGLSAITRTISSPIQYHTRITQPLLHDLLPKPWVRHVLS